MGRHPSIRQAAQALREALDGAEPQLHSGSDAADLVRELARTEKVCAAARARYAARVEECGAHRDAGFTRATDWLAHQTGTSKGKARSDLETAKAAENDADVKQALVSGEVSLDEAREVVSAPEGSRGELLSVAKDHDHAKLKTRARRRRQEAMGESLADKRRAARSFKHWVDDELGMVHVHGVLAPEVGVPFVKRLAAESERLFKAGDRESTSDQRRHDAFVAMLDGKGRGSRRPEMVVVFDAERDAAHIPGVGPLDADAVRDLAKDALFTTLSHDGARIEALIRHGRYVPRWLEVIFELGDPPHFEGVRCADCSATFAIDRDHIDPVANGGATSYENLQPLCPPCHRAKTDRDREAGLLTGAGASGREPPDTR